MGDRSPHTTLVLAQTFRALELGSDSVRHLSDILRIRKKTERPSTPSDWGRVRIEGIRVNDSFGIHLTYFPKNDTYFSKNDTRSQWLPLTPSAVMVTYPILFLLVIES